MSEFKSKYGPWALITGASSGFGAEYARQLAPKGLNLVLVARRADKMKALADELTEKHDIDVHVVAADLSKRDFLAGLLEGVGDREIGLLVNNAGYTMTGEVVELDAERQADMVDLNCRAPLMLARAFGPAMKQRKRGGIMFTSSVVGFSGAPRWALYNATKSFDLILAEGLAAEMKPHGVDVLALCPGGTRTGFAAAGGVTTDIGMLRHVFVMDAPPVVASAIWGLGRRRVVVPGVFNKLASFSTRFQPRRLNTWIFGRVVDLISP